MSESESEEGVEVEALRVSSPSLKWLALYWEEKVESEFNVVVKSENLENLICSLKGRHKVTLDVPNLKSLAVSGDVVEVNVTQSLVSFNETVIEAGLLFQLADVDELFLRAQCAAFTFFSGLQHVKSLSLSENIMKVLLSLFENSPNLEVLIFSEVFDNYFGEDEEFDLVFPLTFVEHLKVIEISSFKGGELEFKLVEYFLKNGKSLEKIALERDGWKSVLKHCNRILSFKKCSEDCQIVFRKKWDFLKCPKLRQAMNLSP
ncbi:hypothetical protein E2542_SST09013 [Spatholobus suberectus]|nr:hypothetical protein E2542_SST09013 [Spatholobus suberectus]